MVLLSNAIKYAEDCIAGKEVTTWEVEKQCEKFLDDYRNRQYDEDFSYYFDEEKLYKVEKIISLMRFATGFLGGKPILNYLAPFQCFLIANIFGWRFKDNEHRFRYREAMLYISRKNAKGTVCAIIFIIGMLLEQNYSEFYSICLDKVLSSELRKQIKQIIEASPALCKRFKISKQWTGNLECLITKSYYKPLTANADKNNSIRGAYVVADELGAFDTKDNINAMMSGQKSVLNPLMFYTTSAYPNSTSIMYEELEYCRKILKGELVNERYFCLIYYANKDEIWEDIGIYRDNPLRIEENYEEIRLFRERAKIVEKDKIEHITKNMNIMLDTATDEEFYLQKDLWKKCEINKIDFTGKNVSVGIDLSKTIDLTSVSIMYEEAGIIYCKSHGFVPRNTLNSPNRTEKINYLEEEALGNVIIQEGDSIKYLDICKYVRNIESKYNCKIKNIYIDPSYSELILNELQNEFDIVVLKQTYTQLSRYTVRFRDLVYEGKVKYEKNNVLDYCVACAKVSEGKAGDIMIAKNRKNKWERIDLLVTLIFCYAEFYSEKKKKNFNEIFNENYIV